LHPNSNVGRGPRVKTIDLRDVDKALAEAEAKGKVAEVVESIGEGVAGAMDLDEDEGEIDRNLTMEVEEIGMDWFVSPAKATFADEDVDAEMYDAVEGRVDGSRNLEDITLPDADTEYFPDSDGFDPDASCGSRMQDEEEGAQSFTHFAIVDESALHMRKFNPSAPESSSESSNDADDTSLTCVDCLHRFRNESYKSRHVCKRQDPRPVTLESRAQVYLAQIVEAEHAKPFLRTTEVPAAAIAAQPGFVASVDAVSRFPLPGFPRGWAFRSSTDVYASVKLTAEVKTGLEELFDAEGEGKLSLEQLHEALRARFPNDACLPGIEDLRSFFSSLVEKKTKIREARAAEKARAERAAREQRALAAAQRRAASDASKKAKSEAKSEAKNARASGDGKARGTGLPDALALLVVTVEAENPGQRKFSVITDLVNERWVGLGNEALTEVQREMVKNKINNTRTKKKQLAAMSSGV
jgi:hypothetical protein